MIVVNKLVKYLILFIVLIILIILLVLIGLPVAQQAIWQGELQKCCERFRANGCIQNPNIICNGYSLGGLMSKMGMDYHLGSSSWKDMEKLCGCEG